DFPISGLPVTSNATGDAKIESSELRTRSLIHHPQDRLRLKSLLHEIKGFLAALIRLWTNPIYVCLIMSSCFVLFSASAIGSFTPKYMERMFNLPAYKANYIMAGQSLSASCVGTILGGYLTKRLKMTAKRALVFSTVILFLSITCTVVAMFFQCEQPTVHNWPGSTESCYDDCHCEDNKYFAICGQDGKTYYSPCTAGCTSVNNGVYQNCTCIAGGTAVAGSCDYGCGQLYAYSIFAALRTVTGTLVIVPKIILMLRCVDDKDRGSALGLSAFMTSLFGWLLGPIFIGYVIDGFCTIWDVTCGKRGRCLLYDNDVFRVKLHGYSATSLACSFVVLLIACIYARCTGCLDEKGQKKKTTPITVPFI
ncbi:solute carrier organic anion transporter family member 2A1, partial [Biomphalaria glabrata]